MPHGGIYGEDQITAGMTSGSDSSPIDRCAPVQCSHLGLVNEQGLLMGGIELNPGPTEKICYERWLRDASRFL